MIHIMLPTQYSSGTGGRLGESHKRLMAAVMQAVVDDCRGGSVYRRSTGGGALDAHTVRKAIAYVTSTDRAWPFSFENLCEALGLDAGGLRDELDVMRARGRASSSARRVGERDAQQDRLPLQRHQRSAAKRRGGT